MRKTSALMLLTYFPLVLSSVSVAQSRKAGLWEVTSKTTFPQSGNQLRMSNGSNAADQSASPPAALQVCYTQDVIDQYGVILPPSMKSCRLSHVTQTRTTFSADMVCNGTYNGRGIIEATWTDDEHVSGKVRFAERTNEANTPRSMQWVREDSATFKSADCGTVRPRAVIPAKSPQPVAAIHP